MGNLSSQWELFASFFFADWDNCVLIFVGGRVLPSANSRKSPTVQQSSPLGPRLPPWIPHPLQWFG